ncbi:MAG: M23 family metallopeptidase, partial [Alphaproteobacteria bacterium]|nr:M23 family metallopeptidase [Alphaproteobacteria bacterium]
MKAQSFPKTFQDLSFTARMDFKSEDYELYQPEYENGFCVKNCAYPGLHIDREHEISNQDTQQALQNSIAYQNQNNTTNQNLPVDTQNIVNAVNNPVNTNTAYTPPTTILGTNNTAGAYCAIRNNQIPVGQGAPFGKPLVGNPRISSPYGPRILHGKQSYHDGIDFAVPVGTDVYSPAEAVVVKVINDNRCGKGLRLKH